MKSSDGLPQQISSGGLVDALPASFPQKETPPPNIYPPLRGQSIPLVSCCVFLMLERGLQGHSQGRACGLSARTAPVLGHLEHVRRSGIDLACFLYFG